MKVCEYCGATLADETLTCPHCSSTKLLEKCPRCGATFEGVVCPTCAESDRARQKSAEAALEKAQAEAKANKGLGWKTALTVLMPYIGGYFLVNEHVKRGFRIFAMAWCALLAIMICTVAGAPGAKVIASLLCLAPVAVYLYKTRERFKGDGQPLKKLPLAAFAAILVVAVIGDVAYTPAAADKPSEKTVATATNAATQTASPFSASTSASNAASAKDAKLTPTTERLEYSLKETDPAALVTCSESTAKIAAESKLDLSTVGVQTVRYSITVGKDTATQNVQFTVKDTKAPEIKLTNAKPSIDQGGSFDPATSISSVSDPVDGALSKVDVEPEAQGANTGTERFYDNGWYLVDGAVDSNTPGTYSLMVKASDKHGNVATKEILVTVNEVVQQAEEPAPVPATYTYILNKNSGKFHLQGCRDVAKMKESNKQEITATRQEMLEWGYSPCGHCNP